PDVTRLVGAEWSAVGDGLDRPLSVALDSTHELVCHADRMVRVLKLDRVVGATGDVEASFISGVDQGPALRLLLRLAGDEIQDVRVVRMEDAHLGRPPRGAAGLDRAREAVVPTHEGDRSGSSTTAGQSFFGGAQHREVGASAGPELEQHAFGLSQFE